MIGNIDLQTLQQLWWLLVSVVGSLFLFLTFIQGGQSLLWQVAQTEIEKSLVINSLGRKWELGFTTLVLFGGALFAAFPKFYATSFGGAYWVWIAILLTFILQAVSYEFRKKPSNLLGSTCYELFLFINGTVGILLIGAAVATFFTGSHFRLNEYNLVQWTHPLRGLEAAFNLFNLSLGLFLVFHARTLGALYLINNIDLKDVPRLDRSLRKSAYINFICSLPFLLFVLYKLAAMNGFHINSTGAVTIVAGKYLLNLLTNPAIFLFLLGGLILVILAVVKSFKSTNGIWLGGIGTVLVGLAIFFLAGYNNTPFYPSKTHLQSSLTIYNASSSKYTLTVMSYVALLIPFVLGYIWYVWRLMDKRKLASEDVAATHSKELY